jgi:hypothetical protein
MGESWIGALKEKFEGTFHPAHMVAGICKSPTLDQVKDLLTHAASLADKAKSATAFAKYAQVLGPAGEKLDGAADDIGKLIKKGKSISGDVSAACEISEAVAV